MTTPAAAGTSIDSRSGSAAPRVPFELSVGVDCALGFTLLAWVAWRVVLERTAATTSTPALHYAVHLAATVPALYFTCICVHDAVHGVLLRDARANQLAGFIMSLGIGLPFAVLQHTHLHHHRTVGTEHDPERVLYGASPWGLPLLLPVVPALYARFLMRLHTRALLLTAVHCTAVGAALVFSGPHLVIYWAIPAALATGWFGFTTVYVPHCQHRGVLMRYMCAHSGYHDDHHRDPRFPFSQYVPLRAWHLAHGAIPTFRAEPAVLALLSRRVSLGAPVHAARLVARAVQPSAPAPGQRT